MWPPSPRPNADASTRFHQLRRDKTTGSRYKRPCSTSNDRGSIVSTTRNRYFRTKRPTLIGGGEGHEGFAATICLRCGRVDRSEFGSRCPSFRVGLSQERKEGERDTIRYDTGDTPPVRHFSSEQPVLRNVHLVDHPPRDAEQKQKMERTFLPLNFVGRSRWPRTTHFLSSSPRKEGEGKERKGRGAKITRPPGTGRVMDRGRRKGRRSFPHPFPSPFAGWLADEIDRVGRQKDATRLERGVRMCTRFNPRPKPPFYRLYFSSDPTPSFVSIRPFPFSLSPFSSRSLYSPLGVKLKFRSDRFERFVFSPPPRFVSFLFKRWPTTWRG